MLTKDHMKQIIKECREIGDSGLKNGVHASIPDLSIDIVSPPLDFLGVSGNSAIFINKATFKLLGSLHTNWIVDRTIALKITLLNQAPIEVIGAIIHETGHAFNVAADIENTEANAYIFEIEVMRHLLKTSSLLPFYCSEADVQSYFKARLPYYVQGAHGNAYLTTLVEEIKTSPKTESKEAVLPKIDLISRTLYLNKEVTLFSSRLPKTKSFKVGFSESEEFTNNPNELNAPFVRSKL